MSVTHNTDNSPKLSANTPFLQSWMVVAGAILAMLSVMLGAFSAHALKNILDEYALSLIDTAARYQMFHALALILCGILSQHLANLKWLKISAISFLIGIAVFSGALYLIAFTGVKAFGMLAPIGGSAMIFGWFCLLLVFKKPRS